MAGTVHNPATPYVGSIPGGVHDGMKIHVTGTTEHHHNGFLISLQCGGSIDPRSECAFVFNPRFSDNQVVRNSLIGGGWGNEERHGGFPFHKGHHTNVVIHVTHHAFKVSVNNHHFCDYSHRMDMHRITHITVEQGIRVNQIRFEGSYPSGGSGYPSAPIYNPPIPFVSNIGGLYPNKMIFISGIPNPNPSRFSIYIQHGHHHEPNDIALVFDARFNYGSDHNAIIRNHKQGGWGSEERHCPYFPFMPNAGFEMIIMVEPHCFKVAVNNQHLLEFAHRIQPVSRCDTLRIDGDVRLTQIRFQ